MLGKAPSTNLANLHRAGATSIRDEKGDLENEGWGSSLIRPPATAPYKRGKKPKDEEILICPLCGNDNGELPTPEGMWASCFIEPSGRWALDPTVVTGGYASAGITPLARRTGQHRRFHCGIQAVPALSLPLMER